MTFLCQPGSVSIRFAGIVPDQPLGSFTIVSQSTPVTLAGGQS